MKKIILSCCLSIVIILVIALPSCEKDENNEEPADPINGTVQDIEGNVYPTVKIGNQWWMAENLNTTKFRSGEDIPNVAGAGEWATTGEAACCASANDPENAEVYGRLYNWHAAADGRKICPSGWHIPGDSDWTTLIEFLGGNEVAGSKLKQTGTVLWSAPNSDATNESGFTAIPGGVRNGNTGDFAGMGINSSWWSATQQNAENGFAWNVTSVNGFVAHYGVDKNTGMAVRCVKD